MHRLLAGWLPTQRWFPTKGRTVELEHIGGLRLLSADAEVEAEDLFLALREGGAPARVVQVPLTYRASPAAGLALRRLLRG